MTDRATSKILYVFTTSDQVSHTFATDNLTLVVKLELYTHH